MKQVMGTLENATWTGVIKKKNQYPGEWFWSVATHQNYLGYFQKIPVPVHPHFQPSHPSISTTAHTATLQMHLEYGVDSEFLKAA